MIFKLNLIPNSSIHQISTLRYLTPSAEFRQQFQYNNLMYETLSYLPTLFLNQSYDSYISEHLFSPLNMSSSTYSVAEAERWGKLANGFMYDMEDEANDVNGTLKATVPYFLRPGEEMIWAGAGGVLTSARDLVCVFREYCDFHRAHHLLG